MSRGGVIALESAARAIEHFEKAVELDDALMERYLEDESSISDDEIRKSIQHQDYNIRNTAAFKALGINSGYIGWRDAGWRARPVI